MGVFLYKEYDGYDYYFIICTPEYTDGIIRGNVENYNEFVKELRNSDLTRYKNSTLCYQNISFLTTDKKPSYILGTILFSNNCLTFINAKYKNKLVMEDEYTVCFCHEGMQEKRNSKSEIRINLKDVYSCEIPTNTNGYKFILHGDFSNIQSGCEVISFFDNEFPLLRQLEKSLANKPIFDSESWLLLYEYNHPPEIKKCRKCGSEKIMPVEDAVEITQAIINVLKGAMLITTIISQGKMNKPFKSSEGIKIYKCEKCGRYSL